MNKGFTILELCVVVVIICISVAVVLICCGSGVAGIATHSGNWGLNANAEDTQDRLFSGESESVLLTIELSRPTGPSAQVEILVNGSSIPDGVLENELAVDDARTWKLTDVVTIDIVGLEATSNITRGRYTISVAL